MQNSAISPLVKLVSVEVSNFKSFSAGIAEQAAESPEHARSHIIGPFTQFTGIIGPNGVGKSNIFDAIAFALNISMAPGKARHTRDLAHVPKKAIIDPFDAGSKPDDGPKDFFVKLNFLKTDVGTGLTEKLSLQRGLRHLENESGEVSYFNEYVVNETHDRPLLFDEYKQLLKGVYHLDFSEFVVY